MWVLALLTLYDISNFNILVCVKLTRRFNVILFVVVV